MTTTSTAMHATTTMSASAVPNSSNQCGHSARMPRPRKWNEGHTGFSTPVPRTSGSHAEAEGSLAGMLRTTICLQFLPERTREIGKKLSACATLLAKSLPSTHANYRYNSCIPQATAAQKQSIPFVGRAAARFGRQGIPQGGARPLMCSGSAESRTIQVINRGDTKCIS